MTCFAGLWKPSDELIGALRRPPAQPAEGEDKERMREPGFCVEAEKAIHETRDSRTPSAKTFIIAGGRVNRVFNVGQSRVSAGFQPAGRTDQAAVGADP